VLAGSHRQGLRRSRDLAGTLRRDLVDVLALGVDGLTCNLAANGHEPENVELLGETLTKVMQG
jgi:hypothetical protein